MTIYHGSENIIEHPAFGKGKRYNDYGMGFYCTEDKRMACEWAVDFGRDGYCNEYSLESDGLKVLRLNDERYSILHWITILVQNRTFDIQTDFAKEAITYLTEYFSIPYEEADVIVGYRADDSYFSYASDFVNNNISLQTLNSAMKLGDLGEQIVLKSKKAFSHIKFEKAKETKCIEWYSAKQARDRVARKAYQKMRNEPWKKGNIYMMALLEGTVSTDDERLRY